MSDLLSDVFNSDVFSMQALTASVNKVPYVPGRIGQLGIFEGQGVETVSVIIEQDEGVVQLIPNTPRGGPPKVLPTRRRRAFSLKIPHLPTRLTVRADQVRGVRAFGQNQLQSVASVLQNKMRAHTLSLDATVEYQRVGAIKGVLLDADGVTEIANLYNEFGETQQTINFELDNASTKVRNKCTAVHRAIESTLGGLFSTGMPRGFCGKNFFDDFIEHAEVKKPYLNYANAVNLTQDKRFGFEFGDILWEEYRGAVVGDDGATSIPFVGDDEAYVVPMGLPGLFATRFGPADYWDTANSIGIPRYASSKMLDHNKGVEIEMQTNPLSFCTRPAAVIKLTKQ